MNDDLTRFGELRFLYACGKLDPEESAWMAAMLLRHPELQAGLEQDREFAHEARAGLEQAGAALPPLVSFETIMARLALEQAVAPTPRDRPKLLARLRDWWQGQLGGGWAVAAVAVLALTTSVQTYRLENAAGEAVYRGLPGANQPAVAGVRLQVILRDDVSLGQLRASLTRLGLQIERGPDAQGAYILRVPEGGAAAAIDGLRADGLLLDARVLDAPAPR